jgi:biopolymer transport protein ExbD
VAGGAGGEDDDGITGINVTPLVDIMLVLLIIFMVTASYIVKPSLEVDLPKAASGGDTLDTTLSLVLAKDGSLFLNGEATTREAIAARCKEVAAKDPKAQAIIAADNAALHGQVVSLIDLIRVNGVLKFAINIQPQDEK